MEKIYIKESDIPITKYRKDLIKRLIMQKGVITYSDPECTVVQCDVKAAYRSISELHAIVTTRFKFTSLQALVKIIKDVITEEKCIALVWCTQINKVVVKYMKNVHADYITTYSKDRYYKTKGVDGFSLEDYENI
jgi:hypothetical protein